MTLEGNEFADGPAGRFMAALGEVPSGVVLVGPVLLGGAIALVSGEWLPFVAGGGISAFFALLPVLSS